MLNQDSGFVRKGLPAIIKLEAYPFTRYGVLLAQVEHVSPDATVDEKRGLVFPVRLTLKSKGLLVDGKLAPLSPGMAVQAEIVIGSRRVIEYLWSPIAKSLTQAGREK